MNNSLFRFVASLIATLFLLLGSTQAQAQALSPVVIRYDYVISEPFDSTPVCNPTGCRFYDMSETWVFPDDVFATLPQVMQDAVPSKRGLAFLDYLAQGPGLQWRRTGMVKLGYREGTPGTVRMRKIQFYPAGRNAGIVSHVPVPEDRMIDIGNGPMPFIDFVHQHPETFVDQLFMGFAVAHPTTLPDGSVVCGSGEQFDMKMYNAGNGKPAQGGVNDGNHRLLANLDAVRKQNTIPGWATGYMDDVECAPEQVSDVMVGNRGADLVVDLGDPNDPADDEGNGRFNYITKVNVGGTAAPEHILSGTRSQGRIDVDPSTNTTVWGESFRRALAKAATVIENGRPGGIYASRVDESTGFVYYVNRSGNGVATSAEIWRDNGDQEPTWKLKLSNQTESLPSQRLEKVTDMLLYVRPRKVGAKYEWVRWAIVTFGSNMLDANSQDAGSYQGRVFVVDLSGVSPVVLQEIQLAYYPGQIALDETTGTLYLGAYRNATTNSSVAVLNLFSGAQTEFPWTNPGKVLGLQVDSKLRRLYVSGSNIESQPDMTFDKVYVRDLNINAWVGEVEVGYSPAFMEIGSRDGVNFLYVVNAGKRYQGVVNGVASYPEDWGMHEINPVTLTARRIETGEQAPLSLAVVPQR